MAGEYDDIIYASKITKVFKNDEEEKRWRAEWEKTRQELIKKYGKRLEKIYLVKKEEKA